MERIYPPIPVPQPAEGQDFDGMAGQLWIEMEGLAQTLSERLGDGLGRSTDFDEYLEGSALAEAFDDYLEAAEVMVERLTGLDPAGPPPGPGPFTQLVKIADLWKLEIMQPDLNHTMMKVDRETALDEARDAVYAVMTWAFAACERIQGAAVEERVRGIRGPGPSQGPGSSE